MGDEVIFGVSIKWVFIIVVFWIMVVSIIFGMGALEDSVIASILAFLILGTIIVVGYFGWIILIPPALLIIAVATILVLRFFAR